MSEAEIPASGEAPQPVAEQAPVRSRHPLAALLTALVVAVSVLALAVVALVVVVVVQAAPADSIVGPSKNVEVTVAGVSAVGAATLSTASGTEAVQIGADGNAKVWRPTVRFGESVIVTLNYASASLEENASGDPAMTCTITSDDGAVYVTSSTTVVGGRAQCIWLNDGKK
jgi:hypothetical protein